MVFKVGGNDVRLLVVRRMLHRTEVVNLLVLRDDHHSAGVLAGGALDPLAALGQPQHLGKRHVLPPHLLQILAHVADGGFLRHRADGARPEHVVLAKQLKGVFVGAGLVLAGEVQVDVGHLVAAEAQKCLKGDVKPVLLIVRAAHRALHVRHIRPATVGMGGVLAVVKVGVLAVGAAVMGGQGVHLGDARHKRHQGRTHRPTGAHQVAVLQRVLHQLLGGHIDHVVMATDDVLQLGVDAVLDNLGRVVPVEGVGLAPHQVLQLPLGVLQLGGE